MAKKMAKKKHPPYYYMAQIHFEMCMSNVTDTLFVMYSPVRTHVWKMKADFEYWRQTVDVLKSFKDKCCSYESLAAKVKNWVTASRRYAQKHKIWKVIVPPDNVPPVATTT